MKKIITNELGKATINTHGAYIDSFELADRHIFFPKLMVTIDGKLKVRGGMHLCAPNFGLDKLTGKLDQHGFARDLEWEELRSDQSSIELGLSGVGDYENVDFKLTYELKDRSLFASLSVKNKTNEDKFIAPGFHPYFYADHKPVVINGVDIDKEDLPSSIYDRTDGQKFIANGNDIEIIGHSNVNEFVIWTDFKGDYICVEPTYNGNAFEDDNKDYYILKPNEEFIQKIEIKVNL